jgi:hypothetical protein
VNELVEMELRYYMAEVEIKYRASIMNMNSTCSRLAAFSNFVSDLSKI